MGIFPENKVDQIQFCELHAPLWAANAAAVGLSPAQAEALLNATKEARGVYDEALARRDAAKAATATADAGIADMKAIASDLIRQIKAFAELKPTPAQKQQVYAVAQIPQPAAPTPQPAPGVASDLEVTLESSGAVTLSWSATDAAASSGAFYNILRKLPGQTAFVPIGGAPGTTTASRRMSYTDVTIPTSAAGTGAQYIIQGRRGSLVGEASQAIVVQFGVDGQPPMVANAALRMAA